MGNEITFQNVYQTQQLSTDFKLGQRGSTPDGREWVYVNAIGAIGKNLLAIPNTVTSVSTTLSSASDNQGRTVYINSASSSFTSGAFQDGVGLINAGTGTGQSFKIKTNTATQVQLYPETALTTALDGTSNMALLTPAAVIVSAITSKIQQTVGATQVSFALGDYGWLLTEGDGGIISNSTLTVGTNFTSGGSTAGYALLGVTTNGPFDAQNLGMTMIANSGSGVAALGRFLIRG